MAVGVSGNERDEADRWVTGDRRCHEGSRGAATQAANVGGQLATGKPGLQPNEPKPATRADAGAGCGGLNSIVAGGLPHQLRDLVKLALAWPPLTRTI